ncbi:MAG: hypothetical protein MK135_17755, partial [Polyangiaceae bacterium]|nr:hypothetical protein [Polyangiaceae bacterium]
MSVKPLHHLVGRALTAFTLLASFGCVVACSNDSSELRAKSQALTAESWQANQAYAVGDLVEYEGKIYRAVQGHTSLNGWTPVAVAALWAFEEVDSGPDSPPTTGGGSSASADAWQVGNSYSEGDVVSYQGSRYRALQPHTSLTGWDPVSIPSLWEFIGLETEYDGPTPPTGPKGSTLTLDYVARQANCDEAPDSCCAPGSTPVALTNGGDTRYSLEPNECILAKDGSDTVFLQSAGPSSLILGQGDDVAMDGVADDFIWGGLGNDTINGYGGTNLFFGGWGDDSIMAANGINTVVPGPGLDNVALGTGDDTVYIFDACEIEPGEKIDAGTGQDTLYLPVSLEEAEALGLIVVGFEEIIVAPDPCRSQCADRTGCSACDGDFDGDGVSNC